ncbi:MAG: BamA/TamA family outer membrane protein [Vicingus serpentipes]|nr:BamA/TamA family outer membrane protein [Vicingus serpentipes]
MFREITIASLVYKSILFIAPLFLFYSCNPTKHLKPDELFLQKVSIKKDNRKIDKEELINIVKQKPNRKILNVFRFHLGVYNFANKKNTTKFKDVGEAPVVYDSLLLQKSIKQLHIHLKNKGFYDNEVTYKTKIHRNKIKVKYIIESKEPYRIKDIEYHIEDENVKTYVLLNHFKTLIKKGVIFDIDLLDAERERIKKTLKNQGYYYFTKDFIKFKVDSTIGNKEINIAVHIANNKIPFENNKDSLISVNHVKYNINDIHVFIAKSFRDSLPNDTIKYNDITVFYDKKLKYKPKMLNHSLGLKKGALYQLDNHQNTYKHFSELRLFKSINIGFEEIESDLLNVNLFLAPNLTKSFSVETTGTNSGGNLGLAGSIIYQNKNLFRGGEHLTVKLNGGLEIQQLINDEQNNINFLGLPFNTLEFGPEVNLEFPRFLLPINMENFSRKANPKTTIKYLLNFQKRPEYSRNLTQLSFGYFWNETKYKKHFINPVNISLIKLNTTDQFQEKLTEENNPFILSSFTDHFINSSTYSFVYNNQQINKVKNFTFFRFNTELAGNLLTAYNNLVNSPKTATNSYEIFEIRYAQYIKGEIDLRYYNQSKLTSFVSRINMGITKPYGNLDVLPFEKSYYGGGANSIRAWQARSLGPGSISDSLIGNSINQIGEIKIEGNLEYRFDITKVFEGAAFVDAGNIWIISPDEKRPQAEINANRLWQDIAIGVGLGLRLDFNFFLFRFDLAAKLKDPSNINPERIDLQWRQPTLNLGIGYPF